MYNGYFSYYFDPTFLILIPAIIVGILAQSKVNKTYRKYSKINIMNGYTGEQIARMMLNEAGLFDVPIEVVNTRLGDHYDPRRRILRLSVEFNASTRALRILKGRNILYADEAAGAAKVLDAAVMTYVAATLMAISQLVRLIAINKRND